jgi:Flp pilus assembly protein TadB
MRIGGFLMAACFFFFAKEIKEEIFKKKVSFKRKTALIFVSNQAAGGGANILQNWAIALAPLVYVAVINALQGVQYAFLLILTVLLSLTRPLWAKRAGFKKDNFSKDYRNFIYWRGTGSFSSIKEK